MKIIENGFYTLLDHEDEKLSDFITYLKENQDDFRNDNLVVDLSKYEKFNSEALEAFLQISNRHKTNKKSFVLVNKGIVIDELPEELTVAPTLREAEDLIQMEEIERDLGF